MKSSTVLLICLFLTVFLSLNRAGATDVAALAPNTWTLTNHTVVAPGGSWDCRYGDGRAVYDKDAGEILTYDGWIGPNRSHAIYANALYGLNILNDKYTLWKASNWGVDNGGNPYALPENTVEPTPPDRHIYGSFVYVPDKNSLYLMYGANMNLSSPHPRDMWVYSKTTGLWRQISTALPYGSDYGLETRMEYFSNSNQLIFLGTQGDKIWGFDLTTETWTQKNATNPISLYAGKTAADPQRQRVVAWAGGGYHINTTQFYAYNFTSDVWTQLAPKNSGPSARFLSDIVYIHKYDVYLIHGGSHVDISDHATIDKETWIYDPRSDLWEQLPTSSLLSNEHFSWAGENMAYDSKNDVVVLQTNPNEGYPYILQFWAYRYKRADAPEAAFTASVSSGGAPLSVSLDAGSSTDDGTIVSYEWDYNYTYEAFTPADTGISKTHEFSQDGKYVVALRVTDADNKSTIATKEIVVGNSSASNEKQGALADGVEVSPNPCNPGTTVRFSIPLKQNMAVAVYDMLGNKVKTLVSGNLNAGQHTIQWQGKDDRGVALSSGVYCLTLKGMSVKASRKIFLIK